MFEPHIPIVHSPIKPPTEKSKAVYVLSDEDGDTMEVFQHPTPGSVILTTSSDGFLLTEAHIDELTKALKRGLSGQV